MKKKNVTLAMLLALLVAPGCSNEETPTPGTTNPQDEKVELGITAGVALTKGVITGGKQEGADGAMKEVMVYVKGTVESNGSYVEGNNQALYKYENSEWKASQIDDATPKIYLTSEVATIYAYYPTDGTKTGDLGFTAAIPATVFEGGTSDDNSLKTKSTITVPANYTSGNILSAPGEVDYMWAEKADNTDKFTASNGKDQNKLSSSVELNMKHAMSMISFRVYNDGNYNMDGKLTQIKVENVSGTALSKGTEADLKMDIASGVITRGSDAAATYTRIIKSDTDDFYTLPKQGTGSYSGNDAAKNAAAVFCMLVLPDASAVAKNTIKATFKIDNVDYEVLLAATDGSSQTNDKAQWEAGKNNIYTVKLSGQSLTLTSVTVAEWGKGNDKDLDIK